MSKKKKPEFMYGIEITKPHSKDMYDHNDICAKEMKYNIRDAWKKALNYLNANLTKDDLKDLNWDEDAFNNESNEISNPILVKLQRGVCYCGYGDGFSVQDVSDAFEKELDNMANWQLHEEYSYMCFEGLVPRSAYMMVGFEWQKHEYNEPSNVISPVCGGPIGFQSSPRTAKIYVD